MKLEAWMVGITAGSREVPGRKGLGQETIMMMLIIMMMIMMMIILIIIIIMKVLQCET